MSPRLSLHRRGIPSCVCYVRDRGHVHQTNEQTILKEPCRLEFRADNVNANVPLRLKGIASFSKSVSARMGWIETRSVLSELISHLIESEDLENADVVQELTPSPIKRDDIDLNNLITWTMITMDNFHM